MLILSSTSDLLKVVTDAAVTVDVYAAWIDILLGTVQPPSRTNTAITTATTTTVVGSPAISAQRNVKLLRIQNKHATTSVGVTVQHTDGTTTVNLVKVLLQAGDTLTINDDGAFSIMDSTGGLKIASSAGRFRRITVLTSGTTFTTGQDTTSIRVRMMGGGGGGAGCTSLAAAASAGGGGGAGGYAEKVFAVTPNTNYTYSIGTAGAGASGALGGNGTDTTFAVGATTVTAKGGSGAPVATAATTLTVYKGGAGGTISTNGDINSSGDPGEYGVTLIVATPIVASGKGGSGPFGAGGLGITAVGNGNNGIGFGSGGGGAATGASTVRTGGSGTAGIIVVEEYS